MTAYRRYFDESKDMYFLMKDDELFEKYIEIWEKLEIVSKTNLTMNLYAITNI